MTTTDDIIPGTGVITSMSGGNIDHQGTATGSGRNEEMRAVMMTSDRDETRSVRSTIAIATDCTVMVTAGENDGENDGESARVAGRNINVHTRGPDLVHGLPRLHRAHTTNR